MLSITISASKETMEFRRLFLVCGICQATRRFARRPSAMAELQSLFALCERLMISTVQRPIFFNRRFNLSPAWPPVADGFQKIGSTIAILNTCVLHHETDHQAKRVDDDMAISPFSLLACIIASYAATFSRFHAPIIDYTSRRTCLFALQLESLHHEMMVEGCPKSQYPPFVKLALDGGMGRKIRQQHAPLATILAAAGCRV